MQTPATPPLLIIALNDSAATAAPALQHALGAEVRIAGSRRAGLTALRREAFHLVLVDEALTGDDEVATAHLYESAGLAPVLEVNFAISAAPRIVRQARAALLRRSTDLRHARRAAASELQGELGSRLAGLLLTSEMLLREAPPSQTPRLRELVAMADDLRNRLRAVA